MDEISTPGPGLVHGFNPVQCSLFVLVAGSASVLGLQPFLGHVPRVCYMP